MKILRPRHGVILRAKWQPSEQAVYSPQHMAFSWNRENKPSRNLPKTSLSQQPFSFIFPQKDGVFVEFTIADHMLRKRIERIMLKNDKCRF